MKNILKSYHYRTLKYYFNVTNSPLTCKNRTLNEQRRVGSRNIRIFASNFLTITPSLRGSI